MTESETGERDGIRIFGQIVPSLIPFGFKLSMTYLSFKKRAQRAGKVFEKQLLESGIDRNTAKEITELYLDAGRLLHNLNIFSFSSFNDF